MMLPGMTVMLVCVASSMSSPPAIITSHFNSRVFYGGNQLFSRPQELSTSSPPNESLNSSPDPPPQEDTTQHSSPNPKPTSSPSPRLTSPAQPTTSPSPHPTPSPLFTTSLSSSPHPTPSSQTPPTAASYTLPSRQPTTAVASTTQLSLTTATTTTNAPTTTTQAPTTSTNAPTTTTQAPTTTTQATTTTTQATTTTTNAPTKTTQALITTKQAHTTTTKAPTTTTKALTTTTQGLTTTTQAPTSSTQTPTTTTHALTTTTQAPTTTTQVPTTIPLKPKPNGDTKISHLPKSPKAYKPYPVTRPRPAKPSPSSEPPSYHETDHEFEVPSCSELTNATYCLEDEKYPAYEIKAAIQYHLDKFNSLYADVADLDTEVSVERPDTLEEETYLCPSETAYIRPLRAQNTDGKWRVIVNEIHLHYKTFTQTARVEDCLTAGEECPKVPICYESKCLQKSIYHRFLVYDPYDQYFPFAIETFKLPASCACLLAAYTVDH